MQFAPLHVFPTAFVSSQGVVLPVFKADQAGSTATVTTSALNDGGELPKRMPGNHLSKYSKVRLKREWKVA